MDIITLKKRLYDIDRRANQYEGERASLVARKAELELDVGLAKGRLAAKKDVEAFIHDIQTEALAKRVKDIELLLTALVSEVLPGESPIGLDLDIERGQPALDIVSRISADMVEDVLEDQGGALTNIISMGLRTIVISRAGLRRFLMLDEPDCWIKNSRIPHFYGVIKDAAKKLKIQCFVISHHDTEYFAEGISIAKLKGHPKNSEGVYVQNDPKRYVWNDDEEGFRSITLKNFQGYINETVNLHPGVNALTGMNNIGKSTFSRAFRAIFYGDSRDSLIRRGENECVAELGLAKKQRLQWSKQRGRLPVWKLLGANGQPVKDEYNTASKTTPSWVEDIFGIKTISGLQPHIVKQKEPIFLLDETKSTRASVLSIGQEASYIRDMIIAYKKMCDEDNIVVRTGEAEAFKIIERLKKLENIMAIYEQVSAIKDGIEILEKNMLKSSKLEDDIMRHEELISKTDMVRKILAATSSVPDMEFVDRLRAEIDITSRLQLDINNLEIMRESLNRARKIAKATNDLPESAPTLVSTDQMIADGTKVHNLRIKINKTKLLADALLQLPEPPSITKVDTAEADIQKIEQLRSKINRVQMEKENADAEISAIEAQLKKMIADTGNVCPLCSSTIEAENFICTEQHIE